MNALLFDFSEDNPIFGALFGNDSSTHRRVAFVASVYDAMFLSALVSVSFRYASFASRSAAAAAATATETSTTTTKTSKIRSLNPFTYFRRSQEAIVGQTPYYKAFIFSFGTMWTGHFLVDSTIHTFEKRFKKLGTKVSTKFASPTNENEITEESDDDEDENENSSYFRSKYRSLSSASSEGKKHLSETTKAVAASSNKIERVNPQEITDNNKKEAQKVVDTSMNRIPSTFFRSSSSEIIRAALLAPFDAITVGIFSSFYSGKPKCAEGVADLILRQKRFDIVLPTIFVTMMVRLVPELMKKPTKVLPTNDDENQKKSTSSRNLSFNTESFTRFLLLPLLGALSMRTVSHRWAMERTLSSTSTATKAGRITRFMTIPRFLLTVTMKTFSGLMTAISTFANIRSLPANAKQAVTISLVTVVMSAGYLALCQFVAMIAVSLCIGIESSQLRLDGVTSEDDEYGNAKSRSRRGKFLTYCAAVNLPSNLTEIGFAASSHKNVGPAMIFHTIYEALVVAVVRGDQVSSYGRERIIADLVDHCEIEKSELKKALRPFQLVDTTSKFSKNNNKEQQDGGGDIDDIEEYVPNFAKRKMILETLLSQIEEKQKYLTSSPITLWEEKQIVPFKVGTNQNDKVLPEWIQLAYQILKVAPSIQNLHKLSSEEHTELLTSATLALMKKK